MNILDKNAKNVKIESMKPYIHKVNYYETDKMGITHHSNYVRFMEETRVFYMDQMGWSYAKMEETGIASPVVSLECTFKKPTTFADEITIELKVEKLSPCKVTFVYEFKHDNQLVCTAKSTHCFLDTNGRPVILEKQIPDFYNKLKEMCI